MEAFFICVHFALMIGAMASMGCKRSSVEETGPVRIAAASDLNLPFEKIAGTFEEETKRKVSFSFGSTGLLAKQITSGAPFDLFAAANAAAVDEVVAKGVCDGSTRRVYGRGRIVVWTRHGAPVSIEDLAKPGFTRIAIAHPEHAPYGIAAREALQRAGLWASVEARIVQGENVRQALQFAESGNVDVAIVALSLVSNDTTHPWTIVDESLHAPIVQTLVVCNGGRNRPGGQAFANQITSPEGQQTMKAFGFSPP